MGPPLCRRILKLLMLLAVCVGLCYIIVQYQSGTSGADMEIDGILVHEQVKVGGHQALRLVGGGSRYKYGVVKLYAAALYLPRGAHRSALRKYRNLGISDLKTEQDFYDTLVSGRFPKALVLSFHRAIKSDAVADALEDSLAPRLSKPTLNAFKELLLDLLGEEVQQGAELYFSCRADEMLIALDSTDEPTSFKDRRICPALFDVYFGESPISQAIKDGVAEGFVALSG